MGHSAEIFDMVGFSCDFQENSFLPQIDFYLGEGEWEEIESVPEDARRLGEALKTMGASCIMADRMMCSGPAAIGWLEGGKGWVPSDERVEELRRLLIDAGLKPVRLAKNRFVSYG